MAISVIREFTNSDKERLNDSALRFADRHSLNAELDYHGYAALYQVLDSHIPEFYPNLKPLWQACKCRALKVPIKMSITVGWGYIGHSVN